MRLRRGVLPTYPFDCCISAHFSNDSGADHGSGSTCGDGDDKRQQYQEDRQFHPGQRDIRLSPNASRVRVGVLERRLRRDDHIGGAVGAYLDGLLDAFR